MSLLWPRRTFKAGMFLDRCWVRAHELQSVVSGPDQMPLHQLDELLAAVPEARRAGGSLVLSVSDAFAQVLALPWMDGLHTDAERREYARAAFERAGMPAGARSVFHVEFRRHGAVGIAYAFDEEWLSEVRHVCSVRGLALRSLMPLSALAYVHSSHQDDVQVLFDRDRIVLLAQGPRGTRAIETEPVVAGDLAAALERLLARLVPSDARQWQWWSALEDSTAIVDLLHARQPEWIWVQQTLEFWSRRQ